MAQCEHTTGNGRCEGAAVEGARLCNPHELTRQGLEREYAAAKVLARPWNAWHAHAQRTRNLLDSMCSPDDTHNLVRPGSVRP